MKRHKAATLNIRQGVSSLFYSFFFQKTLATRPRPICAKSYLFLSLWRTNVNLSNCFHSLSPPKKLSWVESWPSLLRLGSWWESENVGENIATSWKSRTKKRERERLWGFFEHHDLEWNVLISPYVYISHNPTDGKKNFHCLFFSFSKALHNRNVWLDLGGWRRKMIESEGWCFSRRDCCLDICYCFSFDLSCRYRASRSSLGRRVLLRQWWTGCGPGEKGEEKTFAFFFWAAIDDAAASAWSFSFGGDASHDAAFTLDGASAEKNIEKKNNIEEAVAWESAQRISHVRPPLNPFCVS